MVEKLLNLALRLQAYGANASSGGSRDTGSPPEFGQNVLNAVAQGVGQLRYTSLAIVEALVNWQGREEASRLEKEAQQQELKKRASSCLRRVSSVRR